MNFNELNINQKILDALAKENYVTPTPIQEQAIPVVLTGRDLLGCAQTGTGKTAAFAVPILQLLDEKKNSRTGPTKIRSLILTPTRELALQIFESFRTYGQFTKISACVVFGGVSQKQQVDKIMRGVDIIVATPGRLNDLINQGFIDLRHVEIFVLDEADHMLDMGFINDVKKIAARIPKERQTLLFSATMPPEIVKMVNTILVNPVKISVAPPASTVDATEQVLYFVDKNNKSNLLIHLINDVFFRSTLVFTRTKYGADRLVKELVRVGINAQAIHGNKSQNARQDALNNFKNGNISVLVATDIAARGIDIDELSCVFNYDLPEVAETYVHRIGRTGRAGLEGMAISFCCIDEKGDLNGIQRLIGKAIPVVEEHPYPMEVLIPTPKAGQRQHNRAQSTSNQPKRKVAPPRMEGGFNRSKNKPNRKKTWPKKGER